MAIVAVGERDVAWTAGQLKSEERWTWGCFGAISRSAASRVSKNLLRGCERLGWWKALSKGAPSAEGPIPLQAVRLEAGDLGWRPEAGDLRLET